MVFLFVSVPCRSYLTAWTYKRLNQSPTVYFSIWRVSQNAAVSLKHTTTVGPAAVGVQTVSTSFPVALDPSDIMSIHYNIGETIPAIGYGDANSGVETVQTETFQLYHSNITSSTIVQFSQAGVRLQRAVSGRTYPIIVMLDYQGKKRKNTCSRFVLFVRLVAIFHNSERSAF